MEVRQVVAVVVQGCSHLLGPLRLAGPGDQLLTDQEAEVMTCHSSTGYKRRPSTQVRSGQQVPRCADLWWPVERPTWHGARTTCETTWQRIPTHQAISRNLSLSTI